MKTLDDNQTHNQTTHAEKRPKKAWFGQTDPRLGLSDPFRETTMGHGRPISLAGCDPTVGSSRDPTPGSSHDLWLGAKPSRGFGVTHG
jgi:hypothetical protein